MSPRSPEVRVYGTSPLLMLLAGLASLTAGIVIALLTSGSSYESKLGQGGLLIVGIAGLVQAARLRADVKVAVGEDSMTVVRRGRVQATLDYRDVRRDDWSYKPKWDGDPVLWGLFHRPAGLCITVGVHEPRHLLVLENIGAADTVQRIRAHARDATPAAVLQHQTGAPTTLLFPGQTVFVSLAGGRLEVSSARTTESALEVSSDAEGSTSVAPTGAVPAAIGGRPAPPGRVNVTASVDVRLGKHELAVRRL